jgi:hypothetical protein
MKESISDGEYDSVCDEETETPPTALVRHSLMIGSSNAVIEALNKELQVDMELGLKKQAELTTIKAIEQDIDELTSSRDYFEVSPALLDELFQIRALQGKCLWSNTLSRIAGFFKAGVLPLSIHAFFLLSLTPLLKFSMWVWPHAAVTPTPLLVTGCIINCLLWIGSLCLLIGGFATWGGKSIRYTQMNVGVITRPLDDVTEKIPYGAKLKVLEAKNTGIFKNFVYAAPIFNAEKGQHTFNFPSVDPAILGVTPDYRQYMIVYWDIDKDVARVIKEIEQFKKFKLNKTKTI